MPKKQCILRALLIACIVLTVGADVLGSISYSSLAGSLALANTPSTPLGAFSQLAYADDDDEEDVADQLAVWGSFLLMGSLLLGRRLLPLYNEEPKPRFIYREPKVPSIFNPPLERPG